MATAIGDLVSRMRMDTSGFRGPATGVMDTMRKVGVNALRMAGGLLAAGGAAAMVQRQFSAIDSAAKLSDQLGIATEKLQGLRHAAELTGAGAGAMDAGLATMSKRLGEAARGGGDASVALGELGLYAQKLVGMSADQAFYRIAGALESIEEPAKRNAIAANIFSKANMGLLNTLAIGEKGLASAQSEAERLGVAFSRDAARGVEEANDAMHRMSQAVTGLQSRLAIYLAPAVENVVNSFTGAIPTILKTAAALGSAKLAVMGVTAVTRAYAAAQKGAAGATIFLQAMTGPAGWAKLAAGTLAATAAIVAMDRALGDVQTNASSAAAQSRRLSPALASVGAQADGIGAVAQSMERLNRAIPSGLPGSLIVAGTAERKMGLPEGIGRMGELLQNEGAAPALAFQKQIAEYERQRGMAFQPAGGVPLPEMGKVSIAGPMKELIATFPALGNAPGVIGDYVKATVAAEIRVATAYKHLQAVAVEQQGYLDKGISSHAYYLQALAGASQDYLGIVNRESAGLSELATKAEGLNKLLGPFKDLTFAATFAADAVGSVRLPLDLLAEKKEQVGAAVSLGLIDAAQSARLLADAARDADDALGGPKRRIAELTDRLAVLRGTLTENQIALREWAKTPGVTRGEIDQIRTLEDQVAGEESFARANRASESSIATQGSRLTPAMERDSAAAYSTIVNAPGILRPGKSPSESADTKLQHIGERQLLTMDRTLDETRGLRRDLTQRPAPNVPEPGALGGAARDITPPVLEPPRLTLPVPEPPAPTPPLNAARAIDERMAATDGLIAALPGRESPPVAMPAPMPLPPVREAPKRTPAPVPIASYGGSNQSEKIAKEQLRETGHIVSELKRVREAILRTETVAIPI